MDGDISNHPLPDKLGASKLPHQLDALRVCQLKRQGKDDLTGELRILALLSLLDRVPKLGAIAHPFRCTGRRDDLRMHNATLAPVVEG